MKVVANKKHRPSYHPMDILRAKVIITVGVSPEDETDVSRELQVDRGPLITHGDNLVLDFNEIQIPWSTLKKIRTRK
jgi:hypothetical protein